MVKSELKRALILIKIYKIRKKKLSLGLSKQQFR